MMIERRREKKQKEKRRGGTGVVPQEQGPRSPPSPSFPCPTSKFSQGKKKPAPEWQEIGAEPGREDERKREGGG